MKNKLYLGNLNSKRDWGHAKDYIVAQWLMLQQNNPEDFVIATGEQHSVREFVELSFKEVGIDIHWEGKELDEKGIDKKGNVLLEVDKRYFRPTEVATLLGNPKKAKEKLGWQPKITFKELVSGMIKEDLKEAEKEKMLQNNGYKVLNYYE